MFRNSLIYFMFLMTVCMSCTDTPKKHPISMQLADCFIESQPDTALALLFRIKDSIQFFSEQIQMDYHLLTLQAKDRLYFAHTDDSLINHLVHYYENHGTPYKLALAYFLQGKVYADMNDAPQALKAFQKALGIECHDQSLQTQIYTEMRPLFANQGLYVEAIQAALKAKDIYKVQNMEGKTSPLFLDIARLYKVQGVTDSAAYYYRMTGTEALKYQDSAMYYSSLAELEGLLYDINEADKSIRILRQVECRDDVRDKSSVYSILAHIYKDLQEWDSAYYYNQKVISSGDIEKAYYSYKDLYEIEKRNKNYGKAFHYIEKALESKNLIQVITQTEAVTKVNSLYNYQHTENENNRLMIENEKKQSHIYFLMLVLCIAIFFIVGIVIYLWKKKQETLMQAEKFRIYSSKQRMESLASIHENRQKIKELEILLENSLLQKDTLHNQLLATQKELLELMSRQSEVMQKNRKVQDSIFQSSEICSRFKNANLPKSEKISEDDWKKMHITIDAYYPQFVKRLYELCPSLSQKELQICFLIKATISNKIMSCILDCDSSSISRIKKRLYRKMTGEEGSAKNIDQIIADL